MPQNKINYKTIDYVTVGRMMDTIQPPYIINAVNGKKHVVVIGCEHTHNPDHTHFQIIKQYFNNLHPQVTFNEGGQVADSIHFKSIKDAAYKAGELGCLKFLSDSAGIKMINGDMTDSAEFKVMLNKVPHHKLLLYYIIERVVVPYLSGAYGKGSFQELYEKAIVQWFADRGFPLTQDQRSLTYFFQLYRKYTGHNFVLKITPDLELFDYVNPNCEFCQIGRVSKMTRDSVLLSKISMALKRYDRVMVTFGHGHAIAIKPAVFQIVRESD